MKSLESILVGFLALFLIVSINSVFFGIGVAVLAWVWNTLIAALFGLPTLSFVQCLSVAIYFGVVRSILHIFKRKE